MELTPLDVRRKKEDFRRQVRGYDSGQVDAFLDLVADRLDQLVQGEVRYAEEVRLLREQLRGFQERERALNEALIAAQELREEARIQAEKSAEMRVREAAREAEQLVADARTAVQEHERSLSDLGMRRAGFLREMRALLERFLDDVRFEENRRIPQARAEGSPAALGQSASPGDRASTDPEWSDSVSHHAPPAAPAREDTRE